MRRQIAAWGAGEMAQQLRALLVLTENLGSVPSTHTQPTTIHNTSSGDLTPSSDTHTYGADIHASQTQTHIK